MAQTGPHQRAHWRKVKVKARIIAEQNDLLVEVVSGISKERTNDIFDWHNVRVTPAKLVKGSAPNEWIAMAQVECNAPGTFSFALRVRPRIDTSLVSRLVVFA